MKQLSTARALTGQPWCYTSDIEANYEPGTGSSGAGHAGAGTCRGAIPVAAMSQGSRYLGSEYSGVNTDELLVEQRGQCWL